MTEKDIDLESDSLEKETNARKFLLDDVNLDSISSAETIRREQIAAKIQTEDEKDYLSVKSISTQESVEENVGENEDDLLKTECF